MVYGVALCPRDGPYILSQVLRFRGILSALDDPYSSEPFLDYWQFGVDTLMNHPGGRFAYWSALFTCEVPNKYSPSSQRAEKYYSYDN